MGNSSRQVERASEDWVEQLRFVEICTRKRILAHLFGEYESSFRGSGFEFFDHKRYQRGDDYRRIDWNATARLQYPYVKRFHADKEINVWLVGDISSSMFFGSGARSKSDVMREIVAVLGFSASYLNMKVGFLGFSDDVEVLVAPKQSRAITWDILRRIPRSRRDRRSTGFCVAVDALQARIRGTSMIFFMSDFVSIEDMFHQPQVKHLVRHHDLIPVVIEDPVERIIPQIPGVHSVEDSESGRRGMMYWSRENTRKYGAVMRRRDEALIQLFYQLDLDFLRISAGDDDFVDRLVEFFIKRRSLL